jgi:hypothetical protein
VITAVAVTKRCQAPSHEFQGRAIAEANRDIRDRFRRKARNGGASDVLDSDGTEAGSHAAGLPLKLPDPARTGVTQLQAASGQPKQSLRLGR